MFNMLFAIRTIQQRTGKDLGATFLSGTTISNSLTEPYLLFKYLCPNELERQGIRSFDAWAAVFARKSIDYEFSVTNDSPRSIPKSPTSARRRTPVLPAMPKTISIKELMSAGKEKVVIGGIPQPEAGTEKPQDKPKWKMKL